MAWWSMGRGCRAGEGSGDLRVSRGRCGLSGSAGTPQAGAHPPCRSPRLTLLSAAVGVSGMKALSSEDNSKPQRAVSRAPTRAWDPPCCLGAQNKETCSDRS